MLELIDDYINSLKNILDCVQISEVNKAAEILFKAYTNDKSIFIIGNGGSASTAEHFVCDLSKGTVKEGKKRFKVHSINENMSLITAYANDFDYNVIFIEQLKNLLGENDVVIGISASGNSQNILRAIEYANEAGAVTLGMTGFDGGKLKTAAKHCIHISSRNYGQIEDIHLITAHAICQYLKEKI